MNTQIEAFKNELREFIKLSETITPGRWADYSSPSEYEGREISNFTIYTENTHPEDSVNNWQVCSGYGNLSEGFPPKDQGFTNAAFIARSRNISPTMANMLLVAAEMLEHDSIHDPLIVRQRATIRLQQLLKLWEETK